MDTLFINKIAGALLATVLFIVVLHILANEVFHPHIPAETAMAVAVDGSSGSATVAKEVPPLPVLLASGDVDAGVKVAKKCKSCHTFKQGGKKKVGPNLWGVLGRNVASVEGFGYSGALKDFGGAWDYSRLDAFLTSPKRAVKGTKMTFRGLKKAEQRANLIFYLRSLSASPLPLPQ